ncbi:MAG: hypothetical protein ACI9LT_003651, partial [Pseudoalteromonas distincta]
MASSAASHLRPQTQSYLRTALAAHARYVQGLAGGRRADLVRADLADWNLEGALLAEADLTGARLSGAILAGADLSRANLFGADLRDADLRGARLSQADLRGASLRGANLSGADLSGCDLREGCIAMQTRADGFRVLAPEAREGNLEYAVAEGADLTDIMTAADCREATLTGAVLVGARLANARLDGADLSGAQLDGADLSGACLRGAVVAGANLAAAGLDGADLSDLLKAPATVFYVDDQPLHDLIADHEAFCDSEGQQGVAARLAGADFRSMVQLRGRRLSGLPAPG